MSEFVFTPENICDPQNHPRRLYFSCHPADMVHFDIISEKIHDIEPDCVIAYSSANGNEDTHLKLLENFHLTVIFVTENWFSEGTHISEFYHLTKVNKAILPILFDSSLEKRFNQLTNNLQFLRFNDPIFLEKLHRALQDILFDKKLMDKVESVFTHKMFIAYCREDAPQVLRLIYAIRSIKGGRRVAVWYDKYLPMGKNFEDSIFSELDKSDFFAVTLTPNLLNRDNYVKKYELPHANTSGKKIIFFELESVEKAKLDELTEDFDYKYVSLGVEKEFSLFLRDILKEKRKKSEQLESAQTEYLLALAYQNGLFVEFDHQYSAKMLKRAANANNADAAHSLANMLYYGNGISRDVKEAIVWYKKEISIAEMLFKKELENIRKVKKIKIYQYNPKTNQLDINKNADKILELAIEGISSATDDLISRCCNNARVLVNTGKIEEAKNFYLIALRSLDLIDSTANQLYLGQKYRHKVEIEMNHILSSLHLLNIDDANRSWLSCLEKYNNGSKSYTTIHGLLSSAHSYGKMLMVNRCFDKARDVMLQALDVANALSDDKAISNETSICELVLILTRDIGLTYILVDPKLDGQQSADPDAALLMFDKVRLLLDSPPLNQGKNQYLCTQKPRSLLFTGDAYAIIDKHQEAFSSYLAALNQMQKLENGLGDVAMSEDFPIILLDLYSQCVQKLLAYHKSPWLRDIVNNLIERYSKCEFNGIHQPLANESLNALRKALAFLSREDQ